MNRREFLSLSGASLSSPGAGIESAYSPADGSWSIDWPGRVSQHDVIYLSPPEEPSLGLPVGNGDLGALLWTTDSALVVAVNKCDTWDDREPGPYREAEELNSTLRHAGRLVIDFGCPVFDLLYQSQFEGRVRLATGEATLQAATPFAAAAVSCYASAEHRVLVARCEMDAREAYAPGVTVERWGSRVFTRWYSRVNRDASRGLEGTATAIERGRVVIRQKLRTLSFVVAAQLLPSGTPRALHSRGGRMEVAAARRHAFTVLLTVVTSENDPDPPAAAHRILDRAVAEGEPAIRAAHERQWRRFWPASLVDLPNKYLENIWHLVLYYANSSCRGAYPPHFCNGLWAWNRDFMPWTSYFHWNMQWHVWPLHAANHAELALPYYRYRRQSLGHAIEYARDRMGKPGAFYADVADRRGYNAQSSDNDNNRTPGAQIALDFWRHYAFTLDEPFLRESAWPVILEVTRFYAAMVERGGDGLYRARQTSAYEGSPLFDETVTDMAMLRALLPVAVGAGKRVGHDPSELGRWQEIFDHLAPLRLVELSPPEYETRGGEIVHRGGIGAGKKLASRRVFAVGRNKNGEWVRNRYASGKDKMPYYGLPDPELAPVFPAGIIGLGQAGSELFQAAVTQVRLHPTADIDPEARAPASMEGRADQCMGWCPYPVVLARLGLAEELAEELVNTVSTWQFYPQGFGHYGPYFVFKPQSENRWALNHPRDVASKQEFPFPAWPFRHFDNEAMPIVACAINEMLLQSHEGVLRVCPAAPPEGDVRFQLAAQGGFLVSAERRSGKVLWVGVESRAGGLCRMAHPWLAEGSVVCLEAGANETPLARSGDVIEWTTQPGRRYLLVRRREDREQWRVTPMTPQARREPRKLKRATLGRERMF